jgi:hypothetical protein
MAAESHTYQPVERDKQSQETQISEVQNSSQSSTKNVLTTKEGDVARAQGHSKPLRSQIRLNSWTLILAFFTAPWLGITFLYAWAMSLASGPLTNLIPSSQSNSLVLLRILTDGTAILLVTLYAATLEIVAWASVSGDSGLPVSSFLAMSPSTGLRGLLSLLSWNNTSEGRDNHRVWVAKRLAALHI